MDQQAEGHAGLQGRRLRRAAPEPGGRRGARLRVLQRARQLRPALEPHAGRAADRPARPVRADKREDLHPQLARPGDDRDRHLRAALHRIGVFEQSIGELEPILRDELRNVTKALLDPEFTDAERQDEADRIGIALAERAEQLKELESSRGVLTTIDQLEVDGMTSDGPSDGRFVGPSEVRRVVLRLLHRFGGKLTEPARGICRLTGTAELARALLTWAPKAAGGSRWTVGQLAAQLRDGNSIRVTFDNDVASKMEVELISSRHPLVRLALEVLEESDLSLCRFGVVGLPGLEGSPEGLLARVDLVQSGGLRPRLEMWVTGLDLATRREVDLGGLCSSALAHGRLVDVQHQPHPDLDLLLGVLEQNLAIRRRDVEAQRGADNDALVDARTASQLRSIDLKASARTEHAPTGDRSAARLSGGAPPRGPYQKPAP